MTVLVVLIVGLAAALAATGWFLPPAGTEARTPSGCSAEAPGSVRSSAAVFGALVAGWPEGLAVVLALKGLGRCSELRAGALSGLTR